MRKFLSLIEVVSCFKKLSVILSTGVLVTTVFPSIATSNTGDPTIAPPATEKGKAPEDKRIKEIIEGDGKKETSKETTEVEETLKGDDAGAGTLGGVKTAADGAREDNNGRIREIKDHVTSVCGADSASAACHTANRDAKAEVSRLRQRNRDLERQAQGVQRAQEQMTDRSQLEKPQAPQGPKTEIEGPSKVAERDIAPEIQAQPKQETPSLVPEGPADKPGSLETAKRADNQGDTPPLPEPNPRRVERTVEMAEEIKRETDQLADRAVERAIPRVPMEETDARRDAIRDNSSKIAEMRRDAFKDAMKEQNLPANASPAERRAARANALESLDQRTAEKFKEATGLSVADSKKYISEYDNKVLEVENKEINRRMGDYLTNNPDASGEQIRIKSEEIRTDVEAESVVARSSGVQRQLNAGGDPNQVAKQGLGASDHVRQAGIEAGRQRLEQAGYPRSELDQLTSEAQLNDYAYSRGGEELRDNVSRVSRHEQRKALRTLPDDLKVAASPYSRTSTLQEIRNRHSQPGGPVVTNPPDSRPRPGHSPGGSVNDRIGAIKDQIRRGENQNRGIADHRGGKGSGFDNRNNGSSNDFDRRRSSPFDERVRDYSDRNAGNGESENGIRSHSRNSTVGRLQSQLDSLIERSEALRESPQGNRFGSIVGAVSSGVLKGSQRLLSIFQPKEKENSNPGVLSREDELKVVAQEVYKGGNSAKEKSKKEKDLAKKKKRKKVNLDWLDEEQDDVNEFDRSIATAAKEKGIDLDHLRPTRKQLEQKYRGPTEGYQEQLTFTSVNGRSNWEKIRLRHENISTVMKK